MTIVKRLSGNVQKKKKGIEVSLKKWKKKTFRGWSMLIYFEKLLSTEKKKW